MYESDDSQDDVEPMDSNYDDAESENPMELTTNAEYWNPEPPMNVDQETVQRFNNLTNILREENLVESVSARETFTYMLDAAEEKIYREVQPGLFNNEESLQLLMELDGPVPCIIHSESEEASTGLRHGGIGPENTNEIESDDANDVDVARTIRGNAFLPLVPPTENIEDESVVEAQDVAEDVYRTIRHGTIFLPVMSSSVEDSMEEEKEKATTTIHTEGWLCDRTGFIIKSPSYLLAESGLTKAGLQNLISAVEQSDCVTSSLSVH